MSPLLDTLHQDHVNMARLLDLLDRQLQIMRTPERDADYFLLRDIVDWFVAYADVAHHPREGAVYALLAERNRDVADDITTLEHEHQHLAEVGRYLLDLLKQACAGAMTSRAKIQAGGDTFVRMQRAHMDLEESRVLDAAREALTDAEFRHIEQTSGVIADPVFGAETDLRFQRLYQAIVEAPNA